MVIRHGSDDIPGRISDLESRSAEMQNDVHQLRLDYKDTRSDLTGIMSEQSAQRGVLATHGALLEKIDGKLDDTRTRRPNIVAGSMLVIAIVGTTFTYSELRMDPIHRDVDIAVMERAGLRADLTKHSEEVSYLKAKNEFLEKTVANLEQRIWVVENSKQDTDDAVEFQKRTWEELIWLRGAAATK